MDCEELWIHLRREPGVLGEARERRRRIGEIADDRAGIALAERSPRFAERLLAAVKKPGEERIELLGRESRKAGCVELETVHVAAAIGNRAIASILSGARQHCLGADSPAAGRDH